MGALNACDGVTNASASTNEEMVMAESTREVLTFILMERVGVSTAEVALIGAMVEGRGSDVHSGVDV